MKDIIQKEYKALRLFGIKILEFNTIITVDGRNEIRSIKEIITNKDYEILEEYRKKYKNQNYNNVDCVKDNKRWWQE